MDKKNTLIGLALLAGAFVMMYFQAPQPSENTGQSAPTPTQPVTQQKPANPSATAPIISQPTSIGASGPAILETIGSHIDEQVVALENELMEARFTNYGGAIQEITLKEFDKSRDDDSPYIINGNRVAPALELTGLPGLNKDTPYQLVEPSSADTVEYRALIADNLQVTRRYIIEQDTTNEKPYLIRHELEFRNLSNTTLPIGDFSLNAGTVAPSGPQDAQLLTFGYFDGEDTEFLAQGKFTGSSIPFFSSPPRDSISENRNVDWVSLKNQFFITILKPDENGVGYFAQPVPFPQGDNPNPQIGVSGSMKMDSFTLAPMDTQTFGFNYYIGPKEFDRISRV
ncbi:MAG: membrane protein insertase YidC, partial [Opitutales bacterium]|nr:membrane protein insertase YidC [Opitutales bacterium]